VEIHTIGFTQKSASRFFGLMSEAGIRRLVDVRLNNVSQLAGFAKRDDLAFFLAEICDAEYVHEPLLAPTDDLLGAYRKRRIGWAEYEQGFSSISASPCRSPRPPRWRTTDSIRQAHAHWAARVPPRSGGTSPAMRRTG
jgi:hypothetical protein